MSPVYLLSGSVVISGLPIEISVSSSSSSILCGPTTLQHMQENRGKIGQKY